jgi:putative ABC transport system permease protein
MSALGKVVRSGVGRRRVQTTVMTLTTMLAVTASVLAAGLLVASQAPFQHAFARQVGAHLSAMFDGTKATRAQAAATAGATGVTTSAGPFPALTLAPTLKPVLDQGPGLGGAPPPANLPPLTLPPSTVVGRADSGGDLDRLELVDGRWAKGTGEIVWSYGANAPVQPGATVTFADAPGRPTLTVVGLARSVSGTADAWVTPEQLAALAKPGTSVNYQMLYRFQHADTDAQVSADRAAVQAVAPPGSLIGAGSYLQTKLHAEREAAVFTPFLIAFGVLGLVMSMLIIGIVVSGAVSSGTRRIGILKSLGFTPPQVVRAYLAQALIPATVGTAIGVLLGNLGAIPVLREEGDAYGTGTGGIAWWIDLAVPAGALLAVAVAAQLPAMRAGRLRTVETIAVGRTPRVSRGRAIRRLLGRLPLPRPVSLGLANLFTRPARSATIALAVLLGALGVTFGAGLGISVADVQAGLNRRDAGDVVVDGNSPMPGAQFRRPATEDELTAVVAKQAGTARYFTTSEAQVGVTGVSGDVRVIAFHGDSSWGTYQMISGSWFSQPGQAVVASGFLRTTGTRVGDTITLTSGGRSAQVRVVGEALDLHQDGQIVLTDAASLAGLGAIDHEALQVHIELKSNVDPATYTAALDTALEPVGGVAQVNNGEVSSVVVAIDSLAGMLTLMLIVVAGLGVLNTVVLDTRERVHDLGVMKALGMAPRQTVGMVLTAVAALGVVAGLLGVPSGILLHHAVLPAMADAAGTRFPAADINVYGPALLLPVAFGGLVIALLGALLPAGWAARTRTNVALRAE